MNCVIYHKTNIYNLINLKVWGNECKIDIAANVSKIINPTDIIVTPKIKIIYRPVSVTRMENLKVRKNFSSVPG